MSCCGQPKAPVQQAAKPTTFIEKIKNKFATPDVRASRILLCHTCPKLNVIKKDYVSMCKVCKCIVEGKTWLADEHCPLEKW